jgi:hypothetical protein
MALASVRFRGALEIDLAIRMNEQRIFKILVEKLKERK